MGDLVEGIGDEVLLFVSFLGISLVFLFYVSFWRGQRRPAGGAAPQGPQEPPTATPQDDSPNLDQARGGTGLPDGLRHRPHASVTPDDASREESDSTHQQASSNEGGRGTTPTSPTTTKGAGVGLISVKLVQAGGPERTQEVSVTPDTTLDHLRR